MKVLVAIANHGTGNRQYLDQLIAAYKDMPVDVTIVILSNIPKEIASDIEVRVGVPSSNPWSLPFAHRTLFRERINEYDFFIYSEDDTLLQWEALNAFVESVGILQDNEIAGFVRTEHDHSGHLYYSTCHSFFRWDPSSVRERGGKLWAKYSNDHSACFVATQKQIESAIASGGFSEEPHEGRFDMLCTAATDIYTQCGFERLVCVDEIDRFSLPHLPNKYIGKMGLSRVEMAWQIEALREIHNGNISSGELFNPETVLPGGVGSKMCIEAADPKIEMLLGDNSKKILIWGSGDGIFESILQEQGFEVSVVPLNAVLGKSCQKRGLDVLSVDALSSLKGKISFDTVILRDILHLIAQPTELLLELKALLSSGGTLLLRVPNLQDASMVKKKWFDRRFKQYLNNQVDAPLLSSSSLKAIAKKAGLVNLKISYEIPANRKRWGRVLGGAVARNLSPFIYLICKNE